MSQSPKTRPCPKCGRPLQPSGELSLAGSRLDTYECPECIVTCRDFGEPMDLPLVFAVDASGRAFDPARPDAPPPWLLN